MEQIDGTRTIPKTARLIGLTEHVVRRVADAGKLGEPVMHRGHRSFSIAQIEAAVGRKFAADEVSRARNAPALITAKNNRETARRREAEHNAAVRAIAEAATIAERQRWIDAYPYLKIPGIDLSQTRLT